MKPARFASLILRPQRLFQPGHPPPTAWIWQSPTAVIMPALIATTVVREIILKFPPVNGSRSLDHLWAIGIPHIVFTGGEPTLREDLPELIKHAEENGQITGINTNGRRLQDQGYLQKLIDAGLDHVQITFESHLADVHRPHGLPRGRLAGKPCRFKKCPGFQIVRHDQYHHADNQ